MPDLAEQVAAAALKPGGPAKLVRKYSAYTLLAIDEWLVDKGRGLRTFSWRLNERIIVCSVSRNDSVRWGCISPRR